MRFPQDVLDSVELIRYAIDSGMKYIDTSRGYSDAAFRLNCALKDGYREKVILSTKWCPWIKMVREDDDTSESCVRKRIDEALLRLGVDYLDFYQIWNINSPEVWEKATEKGGMLDGIKKAMNEGLVKHTGMTTHESPENLDKYLDQADWCEIILVTYHLLNRRYEPVLKKAKELGIGTAVMNPVGGGKFTEQSPVLMKIAKEVGAESVPDLAVRYVLSNPDVDTILCGMNKISDIDDTIRSADSGPFSEDQIKGINTFFEEHSREHVKFCTSCGYCQPCPAGINIPQIMSALYEERYLELSASAKRIYERATRKVTPEACQNCRKCEEACTQNLEIINELQTAMEMFGEVNIC
jgi:predicted aldo/keto reductase-like oxidoreductase